MESDKALQVTLCMGSSCFARGNNRNLEVARTYLAANRQCECVKLSGHLCEGMCKNGPNVLIGGRLYHQVDPVALVSLLGHHLKAEDESP